jgi:hypothetical protein
MALSWSCAGERGELVVAWSIMKGEKNSRATDTVSICMVGVKWEVVVVVGRECQIELACAEREGEVAGGEGGRGKEGEGAEEELDGGEFLSRT